MRSFVTSLCCALALALAGCIVEAEAPPIEQIPAFGGSTDRLAIAIHGGGDDPEVWAQGALDAVADELPDAQRWERVALDWFEVADRRSSAARAGLELGQHLGQDLMARDERPAHVLLIAHSVGAFLAQGVIEALADQPGAPSIHVVFLDPFCMRRVTDPRWGNQNFGRGADVAISYYATDDGTPSTHDPLEHTQNVDVTAERPADYDPARAHWWPIDAWLERVERDPSLLAPQELAL